VTGHLSVQLYTVRRELAADLPGTLARLVAIGFDTVEGFDLVDLADAYARALPASGLAMPSAHFSLVGADFDAAFDAATRLGVETVIEPWVDPLRWTTRADVEAIAGELNAVAARAADRGLRVGYHNHWFELENRFDGVSALEVLAAALDPEVSLEVDTYWAEIGGEPAPALLRRLGDRVRFLHVKDGPRVRDTTTQTAVGSGELPVAEILAAAPLALRVIELDDYTVGDVFDALAESRRFLVDEIPS
jgi:sugar phosphate isomerase/epimerase